MKPKNWIKKNVFAFRVSFGVFLILNKLYNR